MYKTLLTELKNKDYSLSLLMHKVIKLYGSPKHLHKIKLLQFCLSFCQIGLDFLALLMVQPCH